MPSYRQWLVGCWNPIGYIPPAEAEAQYYRQLANTGAASVT
ncbi:MAG: hypothetical protein ABL858_04845 [Candidatus Nitrotoga sp.]